MAKPRTQTPAVTTFTDHEVIVPPHALKVALRVTGEDEVPDPDPIARAEAALAQLSVEFAGWMQAECDRLDTLRRRARDLGLHGNPGEELFRAAHDIKGQASTFGYPLAAEVAESLCRLLEHTPDPGRIPAHLIDQHVDAVRAMIREDAGNACSSTALALAHILRRITDEFLVEVNGERPGYLDGIVAPPLVPGG